MPFGLANPYFSASRVRSSSSLLAQPRPSGRLAPARPLVWSAPPGIAAACSYCWF